MTSFDRNKGYITHPDLDRYLDFDGLVASALDALRSDETVRYHYDRSLYMDPITIEAAFTIKFPDAEVVAMSFYNRKRPSVEEKFITRMNLHKGMILSAWYAMVKRFDMWFKDMMVRDELVREFSTFRNSTRSMESNQHECTFVVGIGLTSLSAIGALDTCLHRIIEPETFQLVEKAELVFSIKESALTSWNNAKGSYSVHGEVFRGVAARLPIPNWLQLDKKEQVLTFYKHPVIAGEIARACSGFNIHAELGRSGMAPAKRVRVARSVLQIQVPRDVVDLVIEEDMLAFYPALLRKDKEPGRLIIDMDVQPGFKSTLGQDRAWAVTCSLSDSIVSGAARLGLPPPARHFSGSRGIHIVWNLEPLPPTQDVKVIFPSFIEAIWLVDYRLGTTKSSEKWTTEISKILRVFMHALCIHALHGDPGINQILTPEERQKLDLLYNVHACTLDKDDPAYFWKIVLDVQTTCYRWLSPHHKTGLVSRNMLDNNHNIREGFRNYGTMRSSATIEAVLKEANENPDGIVESPGTVTMKMIDAACGADMLGPDIATLVRHGIEEFSNLRPDQYTSMRDEFSGKLRELEEWEK